MSYDGYSFPRWTPAVKQLLLANVAVFAVNALLFGRLSVPDEAGGGAWLAFSWAAAWEGYGLGWLRLLTYQFAHSFSDPLHVLWNMLTLYLFGSMAEARLGYRGIYKLYLLAGVAGAFLHLAIAAAQGRADVPLVGASGSCYGLLLYAAAMAPHSSVVFLIVRMPLWLLAALLVFLGLYSTYVEFATGYPGGVSHGAHLGGALLGYLAFRQNWFVDHVPYEYQPKPWTRLRDAWRRRRQQAAADQARHHELQLDEILAKVKANGLGSLTPAERKFLEKTSQQRRRGS